MKTMKNWVGALLAVGVLTGSSSVLAQSAGVLLPNPDPQKDQAAESDGKKRGARVHDGLYVRGGIGVGYLNDTIDGEVDMTLRGGTAPLELLLGGSPIPGFVLGGGVWVEQMISSEVELESGEREALSDEYSVTYTRLGVFTDVYPNPEGGAHFLFNAGYASLALAEAGADGETLANAKGPAFGLGGGYEWWVGDNLSLGVVAELSYAHLTVETETNDLVSFGLLSSLTWN